MSGNPRQHFVDYCLGWARPDDHAALRQVLETEWDSLPGSQQDLLTGRIEQLQQTYADLKDLIGTIEQVNAGGQNAERVFALLERVQTLCTRLLRGFEFARCDYIAKVGAAESAYVNALGAAMAHVMAAVNWTDRELGRFLGDPDGYQPLGRRIAKWTASAYGVGAGYWRRIVAAREEYARVPKPVLMRAIPFNRSSPDWELATTIKGGGMSKIRLLAATDQHGNILDRMVVKDTIGNGFEDPSRWYGDLTGWSTTRVPLEFHTHALANRGFPKQILDLRSLNPEVDYDREMYRICLAYAAHADIWVLIDNHLKVKQNIPLQFIIYTFRSLIEAGLIMKDGGRREGVGDGEIVHRDLKPENVFLDLPQNSEFPAYPTPKLADFGLAIVTSEADPLNPTLWTGGGTPGYTAPEQHVYMDTASGKVMDEAQLLSACNVWGIGVIIKDMLDCASISEGPEYERRSQYRVKPFARVMHGDDEVCDVVDRCLSYWPQRRPTLEYLKQWIDNKIAGDAWLSQAKNGIQDRHEHMLALADENYKIGMSLSAARAR